MAVLAYNEIVGKTVIVKDGEPYEVLSSHVFRMQQRKPVNQTKLRNLKTGKVTEYSFHQNETAQEADIETQEITYLYNNRGEYWFCEKGNPRNRFQLSEELLGEARNFLKENMDAEAKKFEDEVFAVRVPVKMDLKVTDAPPAVKGNTAQGGNKQVTVETGAVLNVPMFINEGDVIRVNTETGEYVERVEKS